jgi:RNA recognition motif-containing protein
MRIFVGNLAYATTADELVTEFSAYGQVVGAEVVKDRQTGESKGFAFVEMPGKAEARAAIAALNLKEVNGRALTVNEARPRRDAR